VRIERQPGILFHERVDEGATEVLKVTLSDLVAPSPDTLAIEMAAGEESVDVTVRLHAPGFDVAPQPIATMRVHRVRDSKTEEVQFSLTARSPGTAPLRRDITAEFWLRNAPIGTVTHYTMVVPRNYEGMVLGDGRSRAEAFAVPLVRREDCDLVVMIEGRDRPGQPPFRVRVRSEIPGEEYASLDCGDLLLPQNDLAAYIQTSLDPLIGQYPSAEGMAEGDFANAVTKWSSTFVTKLNDLGKQLWSFLPQPFRTEYFRLYQRNVAPRSILIHSDEMLFPWELVVPNDTLNGSFVELPPLGITHVLGRWKPGLRTKPSPQKMRVRKFVVINPSYPQPDSLPWTQAEVAALTKLFPLLEAYRPSTAARIRQDLLQRTDVRILHFSGHGTFNPANADLSELLLEDSGLDAMAISRTRLGTEGSPIVYLNACSVGAAGVTVGRAGGFAAACLDGGFSGVIAPYWPINDHRAAKFSVALYQKMKAGRSIGEALRELRDDNRNDPTFLAFAYFGDPWTRADFKDLVV